MFVCVAECLWPSIRLIDPRSCPASLPRGNKTLSHVFNAVTCSAATNALRLSRVVVRLRAISLLENQAFLPDRRSIVVGCRHLYSVVIEHQLTWDFDEKTATTEDLVVVFSRLFASREFFVAAFAAAGDRQCHVYGGAG